MTERERLIELLQSAQQENLNLLNFEIDILADYLLANGVILPPCKVGQEVYFIKNFFNFVKEPIKEKVCGIKTYSDDMEFTFVTNMQRCFTENDIGKTVFLTKEEAEGKLKEMK